MNVHAQNCQLTILNCQLCFAFNSTLFGQVAYVFTEQMIQQNITNSFELSTVNSERVSNIHS